jgi:hypothetical protein
MRLHAPYTLNGQPIFGTYVAKDLVALNAVDAVGMNMVIGDKQDLYDDTETGSYCSEHGIGIHYHLTHHLYGKPRTQERIDASQTTIPLTMADGIGKQIERPANGVIQIEDELVYYAALTDDALLDCVRGHDGTVATAHREMIILFWPDECRLEVEEVMGTPNMRGYYVLDDSPGDAQSALRAMYRTIRSVDPDIAARPVVAGFGSIASLCNFGPEVCDLMMLYSYPQSEAGYDRTLTSRNAQWSMTEARKQVPGIPYLGVYQAFDAGFEISATPTAEELREQLDDFVREGASGLVAFLCHHQGTEGFAHYDYMMDVLKSVHEEIKATEGLEIAPESPEIAESRVQPPGFWETPPNAVPGLVPAWQLVGPFVAEDDKLDTHLPPDDSIDLDAQYDGKECRIRWNVRLGFGGILGLGELYGSHFFTTGTVSYAMTRVTSPVEQAVQIRFCSDDDSTVQLNGKQVHRFEGVRGVIWDTDIIDVTLPAGESEIVVKVYNRKGTHGLFMRFTDAAGEPLDNVTFDPAGSSAG